MPKLALLLLAWAGWAAGQTVQGVVLNSVSGQGIAGVKVNLFWSGEMTYGTTTDAQGRFRIEGVQPGAYMIDYFSPDYQFEGPTRRPEELRSIRVPAGGPPVELVGHLMPMGRIAGRVVDGTGQPAGKAQVFIAGTGLGLSMPADEQGRFEMHNFIFPGSYTLSAIPGPDFKPPVSEPGSDGHLGWARTYYGGVTVPEAAAKIVVAAGGEVRDLELKLMTAPAHAVRGLAVNPDGTPASKVEITLQGSNGMFHRPSTEDGSFEFPAVIDGDWRLTAAPKGELKLQAMEWVEMAGRDREDVKLRLQPPGKVRVEVVRESMDGVSAPPVRPRPLVLAPVERGREFPGGRLARQVAQPTSDGNYSYDAVYPGFYTLQATGLPGYYLEAIRVGGAMASPEIEVPAGRTTITLVYRTNGGLVRGRAEGCRSGGVALVPQDPAMRAPNFVHLGPCLGADQYEFDTVRPGEYYLLAVADDPTALFQTTEWDDGTLRQASKVTVRAGEMSTLDLKAVAARN